jgi:pyroglutamyl-peptidase
MPSPWAVKRGRYAEPMTATVLLTGFEPFDGATTNPSERVVRALAGEGIDGADLVTAILPVVFADGFARLREAITTCDPDLVVALGQAGGREAVTVERVALNLDDPEQPDNAGEQPVDRTIEADGPVAYRTRLPARRIVTELRASGIPAALSDSAGGHLCNHVFYRLLHLAEHERPDLAGGFVHLPYLPEQVTDGAQPTMDLSLQCRAVRLVVEVALDARG